MNSNKLLDDIERLRGFACIMILIQHIAWICPIRFVYNVVPYNFLVGSAGVYIFFAISGFVVTLSLKEKLDSLSGDSFLDRFLPFRSQLFLFYKKRFFRLIPVIIFVFTLIGLYLCITEKNLDWAVAFFRAPIEIFLGVLNNSLHEFQGIEKIYATGVGPFWTLAIESQFYVFWPIILLLFNSNSGRAAMSLLLGILFLFIIQPITAKFLGYQYYMFFANVAPIFFGSFFAFIYTDNVGKNVNKLYAKIGTALLALSIWYYPNAIRDVFYDKIVPAFASILIVLFAGFIKGSFDFPFFGRIFDFLGRRSYSFYAVQLIVAKYVTLYTDSIYFPKDIFSEYEFFVYQFIMFFVVLFVVTEITYRFIEKPFRKFGSK